MLALTFADDCISGVSFTHSFWGKIKVRSIGSVKLPPGALVKGEIIERDLLLSKLEELADSFSKSEHEAIAVLPEWNVYLRRLKIEGKLRERKVIEQIINRASEFSPAPASSLSTYYKKIPDKRFPGAFFVIATQKQTIADYGSLLLSAGLTPRLLTSSLLATSFFLWSSLRTPGVYLVLEATPGGIFLSFVDEFGPLLVVKDMVPLDKIAPAITEALAFFTRTFSVPVASGILVGSEAMKIDYKRLESMFHIHFVFAQDALSRKQYLSEVENPSEFLDVIPALGAIDMWSKNKILNFMDEKIHLERSDVSVSQESVVVPSDSFNNLLTKHHGNHKRVIIGGLLLLFMVVFGIFVFFRYSSNLAVTTVMSRIFSSNVEVKPTQIPIVTESPTPTLVLVKSDLKIKVLNGTGKRGVATEFAKKLEEEGYKVTSVGNASEFGKNETTIFVRPDKEAFLSMISGDLGKIGYQTTASTSAEIDSDETDVLIVLGEK